MSEKSGKPSVKRPPMWAALMERWDEIEACHLEEVRLGWAKAKSAPKTYDLMRSVIDAARKKDPS